MVQSVVEGPSILGHGWLLLAELFREKGLNCVMNLDIKSFFESFQKQTFFAVYLLIEIKKNEERILGKRLGRRGLPEITPAVRTAYKNESDFDLEKADLGEKQKKIVEIIDSQLILIRPLLRKLQNFISKWEAEFKDGFGKGPFLLELMRKQINDLYSLLVYFVDLLENLRFISRQAFYPVEMDVSQIDKHFFALNNLLKAIHLTVNGTGSALGNLINVEMVRQICAEMKIVPYPPASLGELNQAAVRCTDLAQVDKTFRAGKLALLNEGWHDYLNGDLDNYNFVLVSRLDTALQNEEIEQAELLTMMIKLYQNEIESTYVQRNQQFGQYQDFRLQMREIRRRVMPIVLLPTARTSTSETSTTKSTTTTKPGNPTR